MLLSVPRTHAVFLKKPFFFLHWCKCWAVSSSACLLVSTLPDTDTASGSVNWMNELCWCYLSSCMLFFSLTFVWTEMRCLNTFRRPDEKEKMMHVIGLISGCLVQVISPLDGSFVFLLVLVPLCEGNQVPSIAGVNLETLVNCWEQEKEWCIASKQF